MVAFGGLCRALVARRVWNNTTTRGGGESSAAQAAPMGSLRAATESAHPTAVSRMTGPPRSAMAVRALFEPGREDSNRGSHETQGSGSPDTGL